MQSAPDSLSSDQSTSYVPAIVGASTLYIFTTVSLVLRHNRNFILLWLAQIVSGLGNILYSVGIMVNIYERTGSALKTGLVYVIIGLPAFFFSPYAGALADKYSRRKLIMLSDFARMLVTPLLIFSFRDDGVNVPLLLILLILLSFGGTIRYPARMAIIPEIVRKTKLTEANGILIGTAQAIVAVGYAIGGFLTLSIGFSAFVWFNAATFLVAGLLMYFVNTPFEVERHTSDDTTLSQTIIKGIKDVRKHKVAFPLLVMEIIEHIPHGIWVAAVLLAFVQKSLGGTSADWGYVTSAYFVGMVIGALIANQFPTWINNRTGWVIVINAFITSVLTIVFGWSPTVVAGIVICLVFGLPNAIRDVAQDTLLQAKVEQGLLGRVYSLRNMLCTAVYTVAGLGFSWLADYSNTRWIYYIGGLLYLVTALYGLSVRVLRESSMQSSSDSGD